MFATPIALRWLVALNMPAVRAGYEFEKVEKPRLPAQLKEFKRREKLASGQRSRPTPIAAWTRAGR